MRYYPTWEDCAALCLSRRVFTHAAGAIIVNYQFSILNFLVIPGRMWYHLIKHSE